MHTPWQSRIANKDAIPLTTKTMNGISAFINQRLDDLGGLVARHEELEELLIANPEVAPDITKHRAILKAVFAMVKEEALYGIVTPLVGEEKGADKLMHIVQPETYGELVQKFIKGQEKMRHTYLPRYEELQPDVIAFSEKLFEKLTEEIYDELEAKIGTHKLRNI